MILPSLRGSSGSQGRRKRTRSKVTRIASEWNSTTSSRLRWGLLSWPLEASVARVWPASSDDILIGDEAELLGVASSNDLSFRAAAVHLVKRRPGGTTLRDAHLVLPATLSARALFTLKDLP
jgi:hypothetical protein